MANALRTDRERFPNGFGPGGLSRVVGEAKTCPSGLRIQLAKWFGASHPLVPAQTDSDDRGIRGPEFCGLTKHALRFIDSEMADGIEDPIKRQAQFPLSTHSGAFQPLEDRLEARGVMIAPQVNDADG